MRVEPGRKALAGFTAIGEEVDPGETALEAFLAVGKEVNVLVAHPMVSSGDNERYLHLQLLLIPCALEPTAHLLGSACRMSPNSGRPAITTIHLHVRICVPPTAPYPCSCLVWLGS